MDRIVSRRTVLRYTALGAALVAARPALRFAPAEAAITGWTQSSLAGGYFRAFAYTTNGTVHRILAGSDDSGGIWATDNDGTSWALKTGSSTFTNHTSWTMAVGNSDKQIVYSGDLYGRVPVLKSTDMGNSWTALTGSTPLSGNARRVAGIAVSRVNEGHCYIATGRTDWPGDGVWKWDGSTWSRVGTNLNGFKVSHIVVIPGTDGQGTFDVPIVAVVDTDSCNTLTRGLYYLPTRSSTTWTYLSGQPAAKPTSLALGENLELLYGCEPDTGVDQRRTWRWRYSGNFTPIGNTDSNILQVWDFISGGLTAQGKPIYLCNSFDSFSAISVWRAEDTNDNGSFTWSSSTGLESAMTMGLGRNLSTGKVHASQFTNSGVYAGTVSGSSVSFSRCTSGPNAAEISSMTSRSDGRMLASLIGTYHSGIGTAGGNVNAVAISTDNGATWRRPNTSFVAAHGLSITHSPVSGTLDYVLLGTYKRGLWRSTNGGESFTQVTGTDLGASDTVEAVKFVQYTYNGTTWAVALACVTHHDTANQGPSGCSDEPTFGDVTSKILRSTDLGATWSTMATTHARAFARGISLLSSPNDWPRIWACSDSVVRWSDDLGATWSSLSVGSWKSQSLMPDLGNKDKCLFGTLRSGSNEPVLLDVNVSGTPSYSQIAVGTSRNCKGIYGIALEGSRLFVGLSGSEFGYNQTEEQGGIFYLDSPYTGSWTALESGLTTNHVWSLVTNSAGTLVAGTYGGGVFRGA